MDVHKLRKRRDEQEGTDDWLVTYADAITLLMAFFVLLTSVSRIELPLFEKLQAGIAHNLFRQDMVQPIELMQIDIEDLFFTFNADSFSDVFLDEDGIVIEFQSSGLFESGSAQLEQEALPLLQQITLTLLAPRYVRYRIEIEGHTDDVPIRTPLFPSNWELSAARATSVLRFMVAQGIDAERLKAVAYADVKPKLPNRDRAGNAIPENQAQNRRIVLRVHPRRF